jgi:hypothetical protein
MKVVALSNKAKTIGMFAALVKADEKYAKNFFINYLISRNYSPTEVGQHLEHTFVCVNKYMAEVFKRLCLKGATY